MAPSPRPRPSTNASAAPYLRTKTENPPMLLAQSNGVWPPLSKLEKHSFCINRHSFHSDQPLSKDPISKSAFPRSAQGLLWHNRVASGRCFFFWGGSFGAFFRATDSRPFLIIRGAPLGGVAPTSDAQVDEVIRRNDEFRARESDKRKSECTIRCFPSLWRDSFFFSPITLAQGQCAQVDCAVSAALGGAPRTSPHCTSSCRSRCRRHCTGCVTTALKMTAKSGKPHRSVARRPAAIASFGTSLAPQSSESRPALTLQRGRMACPQAIYAANAADPELGPRLDSVVESLDAVHLRASGIRDRALAGLAASCYGLVTLLDHLSKTPSPSAPSTAPHNSTAESE